MTTPKRIAINPALTVIAIVDMGKWTARVFENGRAENSGRPGQDLEPTQATEVLQRVVMAQHKALCPNGTNVWSGSKTIIMVGQTMTSTRKDEDDS